jgi:hypothetical protein
MWAALMLTAGSLFHGVHLLAQHIDLVSPVAISLVPVAVAGYRRRRAHLGPVQAAPTVPSLEHLT